MANDGKCVWYGASGSLKKKRTVRVWVIALYITHYYAIVRGRTIYYDILRYNRMCYGTDYEILCYIVIAYVILRYLTLVGDIVLYMT